MSRIACPGREEPTAEVCGTGPMPAHPAGAALAGLRRDHDRPEVDMHRRRTAALLALPALTLAALATALTSAPAAADTAPECADGVLVAVDLTDLGGEVETGCAEGDPASGTEALEAAGFTLTKDGAGLICAINAQPDPCPTEFEGSYWAYWQLTDGEWVQASEGSDTYDPAPGDVEGWRYNDGSVPPDFTPAPVGEATDAAEDATDGATDSATTDTAEQGATPSAGAIWGGVLAAIVIVVAVAVGVRRRSRRP